MKLLSKSSVRDQSMNQRKKEIDDGVFIATRVDKLRETLASLESQQKKFIESNQKTINDSLNNLFEKKASMEFEIKRLEKKREELLKPLDEEWDKVQSIQDDMTLKRAEIDAKLIDLETKKREVAHTVIWTEQERHRASVARETAQILAQKAQEKNESANQFFQETCGIKESAEKECEQMKLVLIRKERLLDSQMKHYSDFEKNLKQKERDLSLRETRLSILENTHAKHN